MSLPADRAALPTVAAGVEGEEGGEGVRAVSQALEDLLLVLPKHAVPLPVAVEAARSSIEADLSKRRLGLVVRPVQSIRGGTAFQALEHQQAAGDRTLANGDRGLARSCNSKWHCTLVLPAPRGDCSYSCRCSLQRALTPLAGRDRQVVSMEQWWGGPRWNS